jgi:hypothetical protein
MARITVWLFIDSPDLTVEEMTRRIAFAPEATRTPPTHQNRTTDPMFTYWFWASPDPHVSHKIIYHF